MLVSFSIMGNRGERERSVKFGQMVQGYRRERNPAQSQAGFARQIGERGIDHAHLLRIERGERHPSPDLAIDMVEALEVPKEKRAEFYMRSQFPDDIVNEALAARDAAVKSAAQTEILQRSDLSRSNPNW